MTEQQLVAAAFAAKQRAYAPYSGFSVGAALLHESGAVFSGCNIEAASYGNTVCAERTALVKAVSEGYRSGFTMLAVCADTDTFCTPCGICRQMLLEFAPDLTVLCAAKDGSYARYTLAELLPHSFSAADLARGEE